MVTAVPMLFMEAEKVATIAWRLAMMMIVLGDDWMRKLSFESGSVTMTCFVYVLEEEASLQPITSFVF